jgi:hypothetical protein
LGDLGDLVLGLLGFVANNFDESVLDRNKFGSWLLTAKELSSKLAMKSEMIARIVSVYFGTLHFTDTEFSFMCPDDFSNSIVFYYKKFFFQLMISSAVNQLPARFRRPQTVRSSRWG